MSTLRLNVALVIALLAILVVASPVLAYDELSPSTGKNCNDCHGLESGYTSPTVAPTRKGPHGGYSTGTQKCSTCHTVHAAPAGGVMLLPASTIKATCNSCHDGTGGKGVYGVLDARGLTAGAEHRVDSSATAIPGGDPATGGSRTATFSASGGYLTCSDCHSPHDSNTVTSYAGDRYRTDVSEDLTGTPTNRLLRQQPTSAPSTWTITEYGSTWCGSCHQGRLSGTGVHNHPVGTETDGVYYDNIRRVTAPQTTTVETGTLGANNKGYVMPDNQASRPEPICMQCHEDDRSVGDNASYPQQLDTTETFSITATDGVNASDSPRFQVFPHEGYNYYFQVETNDDLCLNCHAPPP
jgi:hypothetical protein